ncbi:terminase small subunit [Oceanirhabdus sp. W0125-5]|uniref:terminase small subunit n=1 Tax=Oceanirhabdus sp. W0125-5 TaxID=2999116 RepID=UPI0022F2F3AE|nr:terminase small subunit [Oceanirhabdus sp. W0125-5]WBW97584.1 terminase small subunit [Oceanirhabdus sp. W0125-5]
MLTDKQRAFCKYYLKTGNATEAYLKAYKCTSKTANSNGCKLLSNDKIKAYIEELERTGGFEEATEKEIREFFTCTMRDKKAPLNLRMKAAEILGKNFGLTVEQKPQQKEMKIVFNKQGEGVMDE